MVLGHGANGGAGGLGVELAQPEDVQEIADQAEALGRRLVLLSPVPDPDLAPEGVAFREVFDVTVPTQALSLTRLPDEVYPYRIRLFQAVL